MVKRERAASRLAGRFGRYVVQSRPFDMRCKAPEQGHTWISLQERVECREERVDGVEGWTARRACCSSSASLTKARGRKRWLSFSASNDTHPVRSKRQSSPSPPSDGRRPSASNRRRILANASCTPAAELSRQPIYGLPLASGWRRAYSPTTSSNDRRTGGRGHAGFFDR